jgi:hypothetical protein
MRAPGSDCVVGPTPVSARDPLVALSVVLLTCKRLSKVSILSAPLNAILTQVVRSFTFSERRMLGKAV